MCKFAQLYACHELFLKHTSWKVKQIEKNYKFYKGAHNPNNPVIIFCLPPLALQSITVMEIDLLRWGTLLNIIMIIAQIAFSLECHILLDMINICEENFFFEIMRFPWMNWGISDKNNKSNIIGINTDNNDYIIKVIWFYWEQPGWAVPCGFHCIWCCRSELSLNVSTAVDETMHDGSSISLV